MKKILLFISAFMIVGASCTEIVDQKAAPAQQTEPTGTFDCDLSDDEGPVDYYYPEFHAEISEPTPGFFVTTVGAEQRSCDAGPGMSTMKVTLDGEVICHNDTWALVGQCTFNYFGTDKAEVVVTVDWREATETLLVANVWFYEA